MERIAWTALAVVLGASHAAAGPVNLGAMTPGYTFYNRAGATMAAHNADVSECADEAQKTRALDETVPGASGIIGAMISASMANAYHHGAVGAALENCMVVRGWRVVSVPEPLGKTLAALSQDELAARLAPLIGADHPDFPIVRTWDNDAVRASTIRYVMRPAHTNDGELSLKVAVGKTLDQYESTPIERVKPVKLDPKWPRKPLKPQEIDSVPAGAAVIVIGVTGISLKNGNGIVLSRLGPDLKTAASSQDNAPDLAMFGAGSMFAKKGMNYFAVEVPPGRWRIAGIDSGLLLVNFCLGSPSFEVKAGDVVFGGDYDLGSETLGPVLALDGVKAFLAGRPAADRVRAAEFVNGTPGLCGGSGIYAFEVKGAPFEPGYVWGGAAIAASPAALAPATATQPAVTPQH